MPDPWAPVEEVVLYRYVDDQGREVVTSGLEEIPATARPHATVYSPAPPPPPAAPPTHSALQAVTRHVPIWLGPVHVSSLAMGALAAIGAVIALRILRRRKALLTFALAGCAGSLLASAYFGWVLRSAGLSNEGMATPGALIEQAQATARDASARMARDQKLLEAATRE